MAKIDLAYLAKKLRTDPRQRFYLKRADCRVILQIITEELKEAVLRGDDIYLSGFMDLFFAEIKERKFINYKTNLPDVAPKTVTLRMKLRPAFKAKVRSAIRKRRRANANNESET